MNRYKFARLLAAACCGAALLITAACGDGGKSSSIAPPPPAPVAAGPMLLHRGVAAEPVSLDPHYTTAISEDTIVGDMLMGLTTQDAHGRPIPGAATSWETSADGLTWTFHLRDHQWSDGMPVTADDFVYAWRRIEDPKTAAVYASLLYVFKNARSVNTGKMMPEQLGVRAVDDKTIELKLENPAPYLPDLMMHMTTFPLPRHVVEANGKDWVTPENFVGNGPYTLAEWIANDHITLKKNPRFYDAAKVKIDEVTYFPNRDSETALKRFRDGDLDILSNPPAKDIGEIQKTAPTLLHRQPFLANNWMILNVAKRPYTDARVRRALSLAYNPDAVAAGEPPAYSLVPPGMANYPDGIAADFKTTPYEDRVKQAQALMRAAGYGPTRHLKLTISTPAGNNSGTIAAAMRDMLTPIFVDAAVSESEPAVYGRNLGSGNFDIAAFGWAADFDDARNFLFLMQSDNRMNFGHYRNVGFDKLIAKSDLETDLAKRGQMLGEAETMLLKDAPLIPTLYQQTFSLVQSDVKGWFDDANDLNRTRWLSVEKPPAKN